MFAASWRWSRWAIRRRKASAAIRSSSTGRLSGALIFFSTV